MNAKPGYFFWDSVSEGGVYFDGVPVPRATYRCKGKTKITKKAGNAVKHPVTHECKLVTDHPTSYCVCVCGEKFNWKVEALT